MLSGEDHLCGHASYPFVVECDARRFLLPEVARHSQPVLLELDVSVTRRIPLLGLERERLVGGTLHRKDGAWYLFGSPREESFYRLDLWVSDRLTGPYARHPESPVCLEASRSRMGGALRRRGDLLLRLGQDGTRRYGGSLTVCSITKLSTLLFEETLIGSVRIEDAWGPHTLTSSARGTWIDMYTEGTTPAAGFRRLMSLAAVLRSRR